MNVIDSLRSVSAYPMSDSTIIPILANRDIEGGIDATLEVMNSDNYRLAKADLYLWLSTAPNVSQEGISYSFSTDQRMNFEQMSSAIYSSVNPDKPKTSIFGYKGSRR